MLKVVGASWLQTRISTYILVAVGLLGIGAIVLGEFGSVEKDGTYSATVSWNHKGGYRIDFWGQGNDLNALPRGAARAYYKTRIHETGWSIVEIQTSSGYPDAVQAYAAGFLEGSLTWQLIHHHWYNTIGSLCDQEESLERCAKIRSSLRDNAAVIRERADLLATEDPFWHMVRLFYAQLDGMEAGWRFAVRRSRRSVEIDTEDFIWLAMASDFSTVSENLKFATPSATTPASNDVPEPSANILDKSGVIFVKSLLRSDPELQPLLVVAHNTVAPYAKMLRLLKRYTFGYHISASRHSPRVPTRSIFMSSYPGALSSHDEYYVTRGGKANDDFLVIAAIPIRDSLEPSLVESTIEQEKVQGQEKEHESTDYMEGVMSPIRIMVANRLATEARSWSRLLGRGSSAVKPEGTATRRRWVTVRPKDSTVWLIEQYPANIHAVDYSEKFQRNGFVYCDGSSTLPESSKEEDVEQEKQRQELREHQQQREDANFNITRFFRENITSVEAVRQLMRGTTDFFNKNGEVVNASSSAVLNSLGNVATTVPHLFEQLGEFVFRGDLEINPRAVGVIDTKFAIATADGLESFEGTSGPPFGHDLPGGGITPSFDWSLHFSNFSHIGHPENFKFDSVLPQWIWL